MVINNSYDLVIIGIGPAGLSASIYASRYFIDHLIIGETFGGTMSKAHIIGNYPGFESINGTELASKMQNHAEHLGAKICNWKVRSIIHNEEGFDVIITKNKDKKKIKAGIIILASGTKRRVLGISGEKELTGRGVSYCSTCDAPFFKKKVVAVIGGSSAATMSAIHLSEFAKKVFLIYRRDKLQGEPIWSERVIEKNNIEIIYNTNVIKINGVNSVESINIQPNHKKQGALDVDGVFIEIGNIPSFKILEKMQIKLTSDNFIKVKPNQETSIAGLFAAGDITNGSNNFHQIITAASEGAIAAKSVYDFLNSKNDR